MPDAYILGIDPGNENTAWALIDGEDLRPLYIGKQENELAYCAMVDAYQELMERHFHQIDLYVGIEMIASYGMPVGAEVFDTCVWIGELKERLRNWSARKETRFIYRQEEKLTLCHSPRANDATIKQALVDRFAKGQPNNGKGTKKSPGWFYQFRADIWQAYAVAVTYAERERRNE
jgi:hypothetical protein